LTQNERSVYAYILTLVPHFNDADEIQQETNLRLWEEFEKYEPGSDFGAWARKVAYYQVLTFRKRAGRRPGSLSETFLEDVAEELEAPSELADAERAALAACLQKLSAQSQELLRLCYAPGAKIKDVARQLGRPVTAVYQALTRSRSALYECIEQTLRREGLR
jgi:RNA polymerase sigma-70 factor (ECF subfamily)